MPLFMDHHRHVEGLSADAVADAHRKDEQIQDEYGVTYLKSTGSTRQQGRCLLPGRGPVQGGSRGGAPRGPRSRSRRDNRGGGGRGLGRLEPHIQAARGPEHQAPVLFLSPIHASAWEGFLGSPDAVSCIDQRPSVIRSRYPPPGLKAPNTMCCGVG